MFAFDAFGEYKFNTKRSAFTKVVNPFLDLFWKRLFHEIFARIKEFKLKNLQLISTSMLHEIHYP